FQGNAAAVASETLGAISLGAGTVNVIESDTLGNSNTLVLTTLTRNAGAGIRFVGTGTDIGSATNQITFTTTASTAGANGILPGATIVSAANQVDLVAHAAASGASTSVSALPAGSYISG